MSLSAMDEDIAGSVDVDISRTREEVRFLGRSNDQPMNQDPRFSSSQRDELRSSGTGMDSYPWLQSSASASAGHGHNMDSQSDNKPFLNYERTTTDDSPPALSSLARSDGGTLSTTNDRKHDMKSNLGLGDHDAPVSPKPESSTESNQPKYTSGAAAEILLQFGLEKEDLELLISYPEDQITPANLLFILRQIRLQKDERSATTAQQWVPEIDIENRTAGKDADPSQTRRHERTRHESRSRSKSKSPSRRRRGSEGRRNKRRGRSGSPHRSRYRRRSRSRSRSPQQGHRISSRYRSRSRSPERRLSPRRSGRRRSTPRRSRERRSPRRRKRERGSTSESESCPEREMKSRAERLAKKLLETSGVLSLSNQNDLEAVVKSLAPALVAELSKKKSSSSSSSSGKGRKRSSSPPTAGGKRSSASSSSTERKESATNAPKEKPDLQKSESDKASPPAVVTLQGIGTRLSHSDVLSAVEQFGKTKSVVLYRANKECVVIFEKEEDAKKLKSLKSLHVNGIPRKVKEEEAVGKEEQTPPQKKPALSCPSSPESSNEKIHPTLSSSSKAVTSNTKEKHVIAEAKNVSTQQEAKTLQTGSLSAEGGVQTAAIKEKTSSGSKSESPGNKPQTPASEKSKPTVKEAVVDLKDKPKAAEAVKATEVTAETVSKTQKPKTPVDKLPAGEAASKESVSEIAAQDAKKPTKSTAPDNQSDGDNSKPIESETKVQESLEEPKHTAEDVEKEHKPVVEPKNRGTPDKADDADEPMELGVSGGRVSDPVEVVICAEVKGQETSSEAASESPADKPGESRPPTGSVETQPTETSVKASRQESVSSVPESTSRGPEANAEDASHVKQKAAGLVTSQTTPTCAASADESSKAADTSASLTTEVTAAGTQPASSPVVTPPTAGEMMDTLLDASRINYFHTKTCFVLDFLKFGKRQLLISNLPRYDVCRYTEDDVAEQLAPFGFQHTDDSLFVFPQARLAFAMMPTIDDVREVMKAAVRHRILLKGTLLWFKVLSSSKTYRPLGLYKILMKVMKSPVKDEGNRLVYINNISQLETQKLREALQFFTSFKNFMPLLNKVFIEFETVEDADRFGGWYSRVNPGHGHDVQRLNVNQCSSLEADPTSEEERRMDESSANDSSKAASRALAVTEEAAANQHPAHATPLTCGEMIDQYLCSRRIQCKPENFCFTPKFPRKCGCNLMLLTQLPVYNDGCYTEADVAGLLAPFGFQYKEDAIYVVPQAGMAFILMNDAQEVHNVLKSHKERPLTLRGTKLSVNVVASKIKTEPIGFYRSLMDHIDFPVADDGARTLFITNISSSDIRELREALIQIGSVRNFLPLLNKVFIEFDSYRDADRLGVWYSILKQAPGHVVRRLKVPTSGCTSLAPRLPENAFPVHKDVIEGATIPSTDIAIPPGSVAPFWVTMRHVPFVFPTISPWFMTPEYQTIRDMGDIERAKDSSSSTIMLTGLPEGNYKHEDVARLVWPYFPKQTLHSLYYNVTVLPLQRRAFVSFEDSEACCHFVRDHAAKPFCVQGHAVRVHVVLQHMHPESTEEMMFMSLMKWSNAGLPDPDSLEERLLCVGISEASADVVSVALEVVASVSRFVNFLPLANRICIEMADPSAVTKVLKAANTLSANTGGKMASWRKVERFETVKSLKQRLQDSAESPIKLGPAADSVDTTLPASDCPTQRPSSEPLDSESQSAVPTYEPKGSTVSEPVAAGPSSTDTKDEVKTPGTEVDMDSTAASNSNEEVTKTILKEEPHEPLVFSTDVASASAVSSGDVVPAASSPDPSSTAATPEEDLAELPQIDTGGLQAQRLTRTSRSKSEEDEGPGGSSTCWNTTAEEKGRGDLKDAASLNTTFRSKMDTTEETMCKKEESVEDNRLQDDTVKESPGRRRRRRRSTRGKKEETVETNLDEASEQPDGDEEEESMNFVTEEKGKEVEEEEDKEEVTPRRRGRAKGSRQTPVRKSLRGKPVSSQEEKEEEELPPSSLDASSSSLDKDSSNQSKDGDVELQKTEDVEAASQADINAASAGPELLLENKTLEGCAEEEGEEEEDSERSRADIKALNKSRRELHGPEAERSQSPSDFKLPEFKPNNPLGQDFVVLQSGFFCNICSVFYLDESTAKELHCSSQKHYDNLQKHYQTNQQTSSRSSSQCPRGPD